MFRDVVFQGVGLKIIVLNPTPMSALGVKSPHLQFSRVNGRQAGRQAGRQTQGDRHSQAGRQAGKRAGGRAGGQARLTTRRLRKKTSDLYYNILVYYTTLHYTIIYYDM